jgi:hypothetical protein
MAGLEKLLRWIRWYFLPTGGILGYTVRVGILWFAPLMFLGSHVLESSHESGDTLIAEIVRCLASGLIAGLGGYPIGRLALLTQQKLDSRRRESKSRKG